MKKSKRLQPVLRLAERNKQLSEKALGQAQQQLREEQNKLMQLTDYMVNYQANVRAQQAQGIQVPALMRLQEFMVRLQEAVDQQQQQVVLSNLMMEKALALWQVAQGRYQAMESLIDRNIALEAKQEDKRLQMAIDELIQNRFSSS